ncbi:MAG: ribokinase [Actinomycetota bacterium]
MDVVVIGSVNRDISVMAPRLPRPGETVTGTGHFYGPGGKGANQAVAAACLGAEVAMVGRIGDDEHGASLVEGLRRAGVDATGIGVDDRAGTGIAVITIDNRAENTIVISPGANMELAPHHIEACHDLVAGAAVVLAQLEIPMDTVLAAAGITSGLFCLNPAPAEPMPAELLERVDVLVPNRSELGVLAGVDEPGTAAEAVAIARRLRHQGPTVITLGADGAVIVDGDESEIFPAPEIEPVDPTGAGDAFCGALATMLAWGRELERAVPWAVAAGAAAVTRRGAQTAMPTIDEVETLLSE